MRKLSESAGVCTPACIQGVGIRGREGERERGEGREREGGELCATSSILMLPREKD